MNIFNYWTLFKYLKNTFATSKLPLSVVLWAQAGEQGHISFKFNVTLVIKNNLLNLFN